MQINPYLSFDGDCEEAFRFYERCFAGQMGGIFRYAGTPFAADVPADWHDKVMHASVRLGALVLMGADVAPEKFEKPKGFSLSVHIKSEVDASRIFGELGTNGQVVMPLQKTFWSPLFGMVVDQYSISWLINCEGDTT
jgi:PhnB protein